MGVMDRLLLLDEVGEPPALASRRRFSWNPSGSIPAAKLSLTLCLRRENLLPLLGEPLFSVKGSDCRDDDLGSESGVPLRDGPLLGTGDAMTMGGSSGGVRLKLEPRGAGGEGL